MSTSPVKLILVVKKLSRFFHGGTTALRRQLFEVNNYTVVKYRHIKFPTILLTGLEII